MALFGRRVEDPDAPRTFSYVAVSSTGVRVKAKMTAATPAAVAKALSDEGWTPIEVQQQPELSWNVDLGRLFGDRSMRPAELAQFARQVHTLLRVGISVPKTMAALGEEAQPRMAELCQDVAEKVSAGIPLSAALADHPKQFDQVFTAYMAAGEESGTLVETTRRLALMLEKRSEMHKKIKGVTAYPKMVAGTIALLVTGIIMFLVPRYAAIYAGFGAKLPLPTRVLVSISHIMMPLHHKGLLPYPNLVSPLLWLPLLFFGVRAWLRSQADNLEFGRKLDRIRFRMPIFGQLNWRTALFRWASTLAGGLASGVQMYRALDLAADAAGSAWHRLVTAELKESVRTGRPISQAMSGHPDLYPVNVRTMVTTGESAGELSEMLDNVAVAVDQEIDSIIAGLSAKIEVALLVVLGAVVGGTLVVLYLPILNLASTVMKGMNQPGHG